MLDKRKFRKKLILRAILSLQSMGPLTAGTLALLAMFFIGIKSALMFFIGVGALFLGAAAGLKRLLLPSAAMDEQIMAEIKQEKAVEDERKLEDLQRRLKEDGDRRTDTLLSDLRAVMEAFRDDKALMAAAGRDVSLDIFIGTDKLFDGCVRALEHSLFLRERALGMKNPELRKGFEKRRDLVIKEVEQSIVKLGELYAEVQGLSLRGEEDFGPAIRSIRNNLDTNLRILVETDRALQGFADNDTSYEKFEQPADLKE